MLAQIEIHNKHFGNKVLYQDLNLDIYENEKIGFVGRNGTGKSTMFNIILGLDKDYDGDVRLKKSLKIISTRQEHLGFEDLPIIEYILNDLPEYSHLSKIINSFQDNMSSEPTDSDISNYSEALNKFGSYGYYNIEGKVIEDLKRVQIDESKVRQPLSSLSGGQKRLVEVIKCMNADADLILMDEPTNHMDYIAKDWFLEWFSSTQTGVVVISHDRDVLKHVDKIIELKDREIIEYSGNYTDYLRLNSMNANKGVLDFENVQKQIVNTKAKIIHFKRLKEKSRDEGTIKNFLRREQQQRKILAELEEIEKPTFWIDATSQKGLKSEVTDLYQKYKAKNINIDTKIAEVAQGREIMKVESLSLGYGSKILFNNLNFIIKTGDRLQIKGRNGAGKTTLVNHLLAELKSVDGKDELLSTIFSGRITVLNQPKVGIYEQEISLKYMNSTLSEAIEKIYIESGLAVNDEKVRSVMSSYLFNPSEDGKIEVGRLSGGQKARLQLIKMLVNQPDLIILDEPTNHLDLPSIEELENSLKSYSGAILYITHDTYFVNALGGSVIEV